MSVDRIVIYAGAYGQAVHCAKTHGLVPAQWTYLSSAEQLRGLRRPVVWKFGTWYQRPDCDAIEPLLRERDAQVVET